MGWRRPGAIRSALDSWRADTLAGRAKDNIGAARNLLGFSVRAAPNRHGSADREGLPARPANYHQRLRRSWCLCPAPRSLGAPRCELTKQRDHRQACRSVEGILVVVI